MLLKLKSALSLLKENRLYLFTIFGVFAFILLCVYLVTKHSFESRLKTEISIISELTEDLVKSNLQNLETSFYDDIYRIEKMAMETDDKGAIEHYIKLTSNKKIPFTDQVDTLHVYGVFKGEAISSDFKIPLIVMENSAWLKKAKSADWGITLNEPYAEPAICTKDNLISWSKELFGKDSASIGAINLAMHFNAYKELFKGLAKFKGGYVVLLDSNDIIIDHPRDDFIGKHATKVSEGWEALQREEINSVKGVKNYEFNSSYVSKKKILDNWKIYVVIPLDDYYKTLRFALFSTGAVCVFCSLLFTLIILNLNIRSKRAIMENEAKSSFLAVMSHEIRTPLNAIIGLGQLEAANKDLPQKSREVIGKILISSQNLLSIINDILDFSKIESGKFEIVMSEYDIPSLINDVSVISRSYIASKPLDLKIYVSPNMPNRYMGDMQRIKQVINNLMSNAVKYTKKGFVELSVSSITISEKPGIKFKIRDSGIGIKAEDIPKLFSAYNRLDTKRNKTIEGTGLGLSITKKLVELMDGAIEVESAYGKGSEFSVCIPQEIVSHIPIGPEVAKNLELMRYNAEKSVMNKSLVRANLSGASVLVVDDVEMNLEVMRGLLEPYELSIDTATSGQQAIDLLEKGNQYDAIFMDHMMPAMDGIEATRIIRGMGGAYFSQAPIIAFTANAITGNDVMFLEKGFSDFISKPVDIRKLDTCLNKWIRKKDSQDAAKPPHIKPHIDYAAGAEQFGSEELFKKMLESFKKHTPDLLKKLQEQTGNDYAISVHALKGCVRTIFANELGDRAYELEMASKEGNWELVKSKNEDLIRDVQELLDSIPDSTSAG